MEVKEKKLLLISGGKQKSLRHMLFSRKCTFRLRLAVIDEQHKFGVMQS